VAALRLARAHVKVDTLRAVRPEPLCAEEGVV
jgi:hypothetical protein